MQGREQPGEWMGGFFLNPQNNKGPELAVAEPLWVN